ncbi:MAG: hypothetical protein Q8N08_00130 [Methanobacteriaceae archaeon]|nr:hypothetical protein [Methanobacteriaceae archaeon]
MSCYLRHMKDILEEENLHPQDKKDRKEVDLAIRKVVGKTKKDKCNEVWKEVKLWLQDEEKKELLVEKLKG